MGQYLYKLFIPKFPKQNIITYIPSSNFFQFQSKKNDTPKKIIEHAFPQKNKHTQKEKSTQHRPTKKKMAKHAKIAMNFPKSSKASRSGQKGHVG